MSNYSDSDAKTILTDVQMEIAATGQQMKLLATTVRQLTDDVEDLTRALEEFKSSIEDSREKIATDVADVAARSFDEQLKRVEAALTSILNDREKKKWRLFRR